MGVDTEIFISYGILIPVEFGLYLMDKLEEDTENKNNNFYLKSLKFSYDGYDTKYNQMFIHLESQKFTLFDQKTGGRFGRGALLNDMSHIEPNPTQEEKKILDDFCKLALELASNSEFSYIDNFDLQTGTFIFYRNW